ncbi:excisionase [Asanoa ishikariensis]|uniref:DNA binding domain-containing protein, excisionase family n=1 Tax=Asanoa ishikariensis TaxID=137265 RepID=A0A1H3RW51_9ACTN|nr:helix-turn-helix domain-containing protein [Asanoa ishikariensis]GIF66754.1 excisionase [Asanoa ishikariensis]SDZ29964.1 DNA binding domain-containing protein, excisionase family [Asanoa ishikariensis]
MSTKALYTVREAAAILSLSRTVIYELLRSGRLRSVREGAARRIPARAITEYVALLENESIGQAA